MTVWATVADILLGLVVLLVAANPGDTGSRNQRLHSALPDFAVALVAVGLAVTGKAIEVWPGHPDFPSGHMAFVTALGTGLVLRNRAWLPVLSAIWLLAGAALVGAGFHTTIEVLAGTVLGVTTAALSQPIVRRLERGIEQWRPGELPLEWIETRIADSWVYVVRFHEGIAASVTVIWDDPFVWGESHDQAGYIHMLMVDRAFAGHRIGRSLLSWAEDHLRRSGRVLARLDCVRSNRPLRAYYERADYRLVGYKDFPDVEWAFEAALYEKSL